MSQKAYIQNDTIESLKGLEIERQSYINKDDNNWFIAVIRDMENRIEKMIH